MTVLILLLAPFLCCAREGGQGLQRAYEQGAQEAEEGGAGQEEAQDSAQDQADQNTFDQAELVPFAKQFHEEVPFWPKAGEWRVFRRKRTSVRPDKEVKKRHA